MKLPEAIALMLEGKVMADKDGGIHRFQNHPPGSVKWLVLAKASFLPNGFAWMGTESYFDINGWREATPEELKEIGL